MCMLFIAFDSSSEVLFEETHVVLEASCIPAVQPGTWTALPSYLCCGWSFGSESALGHQPMGINVNREVINNEKNNEIHTEY